MLPEPVMSRADGFGRPAPHKLYYNLWEAVFNGGYMIAYIKGLKIKIDKEDLWRLEKYNYHRQNGRIDNLIYFYRNTNKKRYYLHRDIIDCPDGLQVDHINLDTLDNRKCNLRICTDSQNKMNRKVQSNNKYGLKGVYYHKRHKKYYAQIRLNKKKIDIGFFDTKEGAYKAYCEAAKKYHGSFSRF
jgi:hypothetical protein